MKSDLIQSNGGFFLRQKKKNLWYTNEGKFARSPALSGTEILYTFSFIHYIWKVHPMNMFITVDVDLDCMAEAVFVGFWHYKLS